MELHHPIMSKLWDLGGRTKRKNTLQDNTTIDGEIISAGELVVKAQYICSIQVDTNWYWNQHPQQHVITVPKCTILHP